MWLALAALMLATPAPPCAAQERGYLGVDLQDLNAERAHQLGQAVGRDTMSGVLVVNPRRGSPAAQAGLQADDIILGLDGQPMERMAAAVGYIGSRPPGTRLKIQIWRNGERRELAATVTRFPEAQALTTQIQALMNQRRYTEAIQLAERLVEVTRADPGPSSLEHAVALDRLGAALYADGKYSEAEPLNRRALDIREQALGARHPDVGWAHNRLGNTLDMLGRYDEAATQYRSMISIMEESRGIEHDDVGFGFGNLGNTLRKAGRYPEAAEALRRALAIREKALGPENAKLLWTLEKLGDALLAAGTYDAANTVQRRATAIWEKTQLPPPTDPIPRIETGTHGAQIWRIDVDAACRLMVTGSEDKSARVWALPQDGAGEPRLLHVLRVPIGPGDDGKIFAVALSPDDRFVAAGGLNRSTGDHWVYIFETTTGKLLRRLGKLDSAVLHLKFSPDGKHLAATLSGSGLRVWETENWVLVGADMDYDRSRSNGVVFDAAGRLYTVAYDGYLRRYGLDFKLEAKVKTHGGDDPYTVAVHPKGAMVAVGFSTSSAVEIYDTQELKLLFVADTGGARYPYSNFIAVGWSADGERLYAGGRYNRQNGYPVRIWQREGRGEARDIPIAHNTVMGVQACGDSMAVVASDPAFGLISLTGEKRLWQESKNPDLRGKVGNDFKVSDDGSKVRFGLGRNGDSPVLFDVLTGHLLDQPGPGNALAKPDVESLKLSDWKNNKTPKLDGKPLELTPLEEAKSVAVAPGGDRFVLGTSWGLRAYHKNGKTLWRKPVPGVAWGVNVTRDGKLVVAAYGDGTVRWHRLSDGMEILALFVQAGSREWVLWTPQGYYASSVAGDQLFGWHLNKGWDQAGEFVTANRLKQHLYRPDVIKRAFELADAEAAVREAGLQGFQLADLAIRTPPQFRIIDPHDKAHANRSPVAVQIAVASADDPITGFDVKVNGRQVTPRAVRDLPRGAREAEPPTLNVPLEKGENRIQITARNDVGETVNELMVYLDREGLLDRKGRLLVLSVGVDDYSRLGQGSALHYAGADARLIIDTLTQKAGPLHTEVKSKLLVSGGDTPPTKVNIEDALDLFRETQPEDTVILFLAGHGVNEGADYLFMPEDAEKLDNDHWRPSSVVRWHVLQHALQEAHGNRIMFVDTCHARGAFSPRLVKDAFDANIVVFSATDQDSLAQERSDLGHGVFSYALSEGLKGAAITKRGGVSLFQLGEFVSEEVKRLTNDEQEPTFSLSQVKNFVLTVP
jgi:WD40 repeat protein